MVNRKNSNKMMIDNDYFYGMGEYVDSYQGGMINPFSERTVPRSPSQALLTTKYDLATNRSSEVNGGFVHRPIKYRGVGAGMYNDEVEGGDFFDGFNKALHLRPSQRLSEKKVKKGFDTVNKNIISPMATVTKYVAPLLGPYGLPVSAALGAVGYGEPFKNKPRMNKRAQIVKRIMNERGVSMIEASKIVKNEGLY